MLRKNGMLHCKVLKFELQKEKIKFHLLMWLCNPRGVTGPGCIKFYLFFNSIQLNLIVMD